MPRRLQLPLALALLAACAAAVGSLDGEPAVPEAAAATDSRCSGAGADPAHARLAVVRDATLCLINRRRTAHGLRPLEPSRQLDRAARAHSRAMARRGFFAHTDPRGADAVDRVRRAGYLAGALGWAVGENIGWGAGPRATPRRMVRSWMNSQGHRRNILSADFREVGVGVVRGAPVPGYTGAATYTTDFGRR